MLGWSQWSLSLWLSQEPTLLLVVCLQLLLFFFFFFLPMLMLCHLWVPAEWIRAACQLSLPVRAHKIAWAHGVLAPLLLLLAEE